MCRRCIRNRAGSRCVEWDEEEFPMTSSGPPTGKLVAVVVGVILAIGVLTVGGLVVAGYIFASRVSVSTSRDARGRERTVRVDTPLGRLRLDQEPVDPKRLDIPLYPGAVARQQDSGARVDVDLDFADKKFRVLAVEMETVKTYEGTHNIHALVIGERVTGLAAYK